MRIKSALAGLSLLTLTGCPIRPNNDYQKTKQVEVAPRVEFSRDKILTVSFEDYCLNQGKSTLSYNIIGVHGVVSGSFGGVNRPLEKVVPPGTEVVVDYRFGVAGVSSVDILYESGTALVPKR